jgi:lysozyme
LPDVSTPEEIKQDALAQAQKVVWRLASMGGYSDRDLPYALDLEKQMCSLLIYWCLSEKCNQKRSNFVGTYFSGITKGKNWSNSFLVFLSKFP